MPQEQLYVGSKLIKAYRLSKHDFRDMQGNESDGKPDEPGYAVIYPDGYISWSPKETFEEAYRLVTDKEKKLF